MSGIALTSRPSSDPADLRSPGVPPSAPGTDRGTTRQITIRSTQMSHVLYEELARAHLEQRLAQAERQRLADHVVRVARARRQARRARQQLERAQLRLRLLHG
jgi:hypothetical protein